MENENEQAPVEVVEQEGTTSQEEVTEPQEETVTIPKSRFTKLQRKAIAYDARDKSSKDLPTQTPQSPAFDPFVETFAAVKDLAADELSALTLEARSLGVDPVKFIKSNAGKAQLDQLRKAKKSEDAAEVIPGRSPVFKKYTMNDFSKMTAKEMEAKLSENE